MDNVIDICESLALSVNEDSEHIPLLTSNADNSTFDAGQLLSSNTLLSSISFHCQDNERVLILDARFVESDKPYDFNGDYLLINYSVKERQPDDRFIVLTSRKALVLKKQREMHVLDKVIGLYLFDFSTDKNARN